MFHENHDKWNCAQPFLNVCHKIFYNYIANFVKLFGEKRFINSVKVFPANLKSIDPIEKCSHIIELLNHMLVF